MEAALASALARPVDPGSPSSAVRVARDSAKPAARAIAEEFEAVFLATMLDGMFTGIDVQPPFGGGSTEKTYRSLLVSEYAKQISHSGGLGIADQIARDLIAIQEDAQR